MGIDLELAIFAVVFFAQFLLGFISVRQGFRLSDKFNTVLQSKTRVAEMMEKYSRIVEPINLKVDADITEPARAQVNTLLINKSFVYHYNLYSNYYVLWQLMLLTPSTTKLLHDIRLWYIAYSIELLVFIIAITVFPLAIYVAIAITLILIGLSIIARFEQVSIHERVVDLLFDLADLTDAEIIRAKELGESLSSEVFSYSVTWPVKVVRFLIP